jgi:sigma-54 dependent transcriptional regulator, acetoin dehydrogenase operon transcriptional activator AcoR
MQLSLSEGSRQAHAILQRDGVVPANILAIDIYDSWLRCVAMGLDANRPPQLEHASAGLLRAERERHGFVRGLALAEMQTLHHQIAGSNFLIAFATPEGLLLDAVADKSISAAPEGKCIRPGSLWGEQYSGTNGIGTVALLKRPLIVHGEEHFFSRYRSLTCCAAPVFAADGSLAGILDASSDCVSRQMHTQALVEMSATQIANGLFRERHRQDILIAFHNRGEFLHTLSAGLLAVGENGNVVGANHAARVLLHGLPIAPDRPFDDIFRTHFGAFVSEGRNQERQRLQDQVGSSYVATIEHPYVSPMLRAVSAPNQARAKTPDTAFVSFDPTVAAIVRQTEAAAHRKMPVLICGETGTGKELLARHAHRASGRAGAFVAVNCAALPEGLIESELFGYSEGAFTGARKGGSPGLFKQAHGGTLFLDEIGAMPVALQAVLLRFLDDWTVRPVGGATRQVDVFLISATNVALDQAVAKGAFRADLLFRVNALEVNLPPLSQRSDFAAIVRHSLASIDKNRSITEAAVDHLAACAWPGNIRQLRNVLSRLVLQDSAPILDLPMVLSVVGRRAGEKVDIGRGSTLHAQHCARVLATYAEMGSNVSRAARKLGVSRNTVYRVLAEQANQAK